MRVVTLLSMLCLIICGGCMLTEPGSESMSSIVVENCSVKEARAVAKEVFQEKYYRISVDNNNYITFVRAGTVDDRLRYARYQESLRMQVVTVYEDYNGGCLIRADAYAVRGDSGIRQPVMKLARRPYQNILREIRDRFEKADDE